MAETLKLDGTDQLDFDRETVERAYELAGGSHL